MMTNLFTARVSAETEWQLCFSVRTPNDVTDIEDLPGFLLPKIIVLNAIEDVRHG